MLVLLMIGSAIKNVLPKPLSHQYMLDAITRLNQLSSQPKPLVYYNESRLRYYAGAPFLYKETREQGVQMLKQAIEDNSIHKYEFLLLCYSESNKNIIESELAKLKEFRLAANIKAKQSNKGVFLLCKSCTK